MVERGRYAESPPPLLRGVKLAPPELPLARAEAGITCRTATLPCRKACCFQPCSRLVGVHRVAFKFKPCKCGLLMEDSPAMALGSAPMCQAVRHRCCQACSCRPWPRVGQPFHNASHNATALLTVVSI